MLLCCDREKEKEGGEKGEEKDVFVFKNLILNFSLGTDFQVEEIEDAHARVVREYNTKAVNRMYHTATHSIYYNRTLQAVLIDQREYLYHLPVRTPITFTRYLYQMHFRPFPTHTFISEHSFLYGDR